MTETGYPEILIAPGSPQTFPPLLKNFDALRVASHNQENKPLHPRFGAAIVKVVDHFNLSILHFCLALYDAVEVKSLPPPHG